eukprot:m.19745 g.19745  ORF g.19745 m.19745 type:complete len:266 (-) comp10951_c0_seq2:93-890(-)
MDDEFEAAPDTKVEVSVDDGEDELLLLKVPAVVAELWDKQGNGSVLGSLKTLSSDARSSSTQRKRGGKRDMAMRIDLPDDMLDAHYAKTRLIVPGVMKCRGTDVANEGTGDTLVVMSEGDKPTTDDAAIGACSLTGTVVTRIDAQFVAGKEMDMLVRQTHEKHSAKGRSKVAEDVAQELTDNSHRDRLQRKAHQNRKQRGDPEEVKQKLFQLFGEHEYYGLHDLAEMTNEPKTYLTEILEQIADYESTGVHRNKWHLKEELKAYW